MENSSVTSSPTSYSATSIDNHSTSSSSSSSNSNTNKGSTNSSSSVSRRGGPSRAMSGASGSTTTGVIGSRNLGGSGILSTPTTPGGSGSGSGGGIGPGSSSSNTSSPWGSIASRKAIGSGAIGSERSVSASSPSAVNTSITAGGDWFPSASAIGGGKGSSGSPYPAGLGGGRPSSSQTVAPPLHIETSTPTPNQQQQQQQSSLQLHPGPPARSISSSGVASIGSERRQASEAASARSSRPASPTISLSSNSHHSSSNAPSSSGLTSGLNTMSSSGFLSNESTHRGHSANDLGGPAGTTSAANASTLPSSTPSELESAFDAMLRGSPAFQEVLSRMGALESQVHQLISHSLNAPQSAHANGHFDLTPARSPSVSATSATGSFLTAPAPGNSRPSSLFIPNHPQGGAASLPATALHSPAVPQPLTEPSTPSVYHQQHPAGPSVDRDVIRQLTAQLSTLGNNVAHLMAQQQQQQHHQPAVPQTPSGVSTPGGITPSGTPGPGNWPFEGPGGHHGGHGPHGHGPLPTHPALGRPNLSGLRAASYDVPRGGPLPRGSAAAAAGYEERETHHRKRGGHLNLQAPTPMGLGSRRHSSDVVDNMHAAAEGMSGPGGNQSLLGKWEALGVTGDLLRAIVKYGIGPPSKIQMKAIPCVLNTQDIVAQASSIQERIQCYVIPALQRVYSLLTNAAVANISENGTADPAPLKGVQVLILTATIDQAGQAHRMCLGLGQSLGITSSLVVGHGDVSSELASLSANPPHVLVGTPQKLLDLLAIRSIPVEKLSLLIIDEMDQLIARNLSEFVNNLARLLPPPISNGSTNSRDRSPAPGSNANGFKPFDDSVASASRGQERQTAIFSCTVPQEVLNFASALNLREPVRVLVRRENNQDSATPQTPSLRGMKHYFLYLAMGNTGPSGTRTPGGRPDNSGPIREWKLEALADLCSDADFAQGVVYCSSIDAVEAVSYKLVSRNIDALALHGDMGASARHAIIGKFRSGNSGAGRGASSGMKRVLVVYDALCRTLSDIHQVALVINFDLPRAVEDYVHRVSCAASSGYGRAGSSVNMVAGPGDIEMLRAIESFYRLKINELPPSLSNVC